MAGMHAREDGSFGRSAGTQTLKGAALLLVAVVIGVVLLHTAPKATTTVSTGGSTPARQHPDDQGAQEGPHRAHDGGSGGHDDHAAPGASGQPGEYGGGQRDGSWRPRRQDQGAAEPGRLQHRQAGGERPANVATSSVYYVAGYQPDALAVAAALSLAPASVQPMPSPPPVPAAD